VLRASAQAVPPAADGQGSSPVVDVRGLTRRFGRLVAVDRVSFEIRPGEIFALIGPNGAGKSTLMKMLTTMLPPSAGSASIAGFDVARQPQKVRERIGYVPQRLSADGELTGYENMVLSARLYLIPPQTRRARIDAALALMDLTEAKDRLVSTYSGGMARRLEVAQSTLHGPAVLFLDEPTVGLDPGGRRAVWRHVRELRDRIGAAVVFSTHYMEEVEEEAERVALVARGRLAAVGSPAELKAAQGADASLEEVFTALTQAPLRPGGPAP
jgi:ABC-2 type transport system ATP-binding protein